MSSDAAPAASQHTQNDNAKSAEDAQKLLAELSGDVSKQPEEPQTAMGETTTSDEKKEQTSESAAQTAESAPEAEATAEKDERQERRHERSDRGGRGGRGRGRGGRGGGGGGFQKHNTRDNIKSDLTTQEESDDPVAIRKQVEFYFSDSNLPMDKFLLEKVGGSKNNPVELKILHSFKRMRHFQPFEAIVNALKESTFLELTDDETCVRRKEPLPESLNDGPDRDVVRVFEDRAMPRSVYVKGFGEEDKDTQFNIEAFFAPYGPTNAIRLRRSDAKLFKGSVFTEFETEELAEKFLALDPRPQYKGRDLQIMSKKEYCEKKVEDIKSGKIQGNRNGSSRGGRNDRRNGRDFKRKRDNEDDRDWRERRDDDRKQGFKDRRNNRDRESRGGRDRRDQRHERENVDSSGIPVVKVDTERADAIARAKAAVEADVKKDDTTNGDAAATKKRARENDATEGEIASKKQDVKVEESS